MDKGMFSTCSQSAWKMILAPAIIILSFFLLTSTIAVAQDPKDSARMIFLGKTFEFLHHRALSGGAKFWEYTPRDEEILGIKEHILLWQFSKKESLSQVVQTFQDIIQKGQGEMLTQGGSTNREYFDAFFYTCERNQCVEFTLNRLWQDGNGVRGASYMKKFEGPDQELLARKTATAYLDPWLREFRQLNLPQPWKVPPSSNSPYIQRQAKAYTKEGLALVANGDLKGRSLLEKAKDLTPNDPIAHMNYANVLMVIARNLEPQGGNAALQRYQEAEASWFSALSLIELQNGKEALRAQCLFKLGEIHEYAYADTKKAAEFYEKALRLNPNHPSAREALAQVGTKTKQSH
jgi:tetratricopeptide (TPR) repeat protein